MKFIVSSLKRDVIFGKNWENKMKGKADCASNSICFKHAGDGYINQANETIKKLFYNPYSTIIRIIALCFPLYCVTEMIKVVVVIKKKT